MIHIYTDGSCNNKTKDKGGYGIVIKNGNEVKKLWNGSFVQSTSSRMEIMAVLSAINYLQGCDDDVIIYCDNQYVVNTFEKDWLWKWEREGFQGRKNADLWEKVIHFYKKLNCNINFRWVKGHDGNRYNELADSLAKKGSELNKKIIDRRI